MGPVLDLLIVTASNSAQARRFRLELSRLTRRGLLPGIAATHVLPDPRGRRAGSGSSTLLAMQWAAHRFGARGPAGVRQAFAKRRIAIIHCGGDSRRFPAFSARGKVFAPMSAQLGADDSVLSRLVHDLVSIVPRPGQVIVAAGDMMLALHGRGIDLSGPDITVLASPQPHATAARHGVFVAHNGRIRSALQKPTLAQARAAGAVDGRGRLLVDTGVIAFSAAACQALLRSAGAALMQRIATATAPSIDLYDHLMRAAMPGLSLRDYAAPYRAIGQWGDDLARLHRGLRRRRVDAAILDPCSFDHAGTTREYLELLTASQSNVRLHSVSAHDPAHRGRTAIVDSILRRVRLGGDNLVIGLGALGGSIELPHAWCAFEVPLLGQRVVRVLHGLDDDFKTGFDHGGTFGGQPMRRFVSVRGIASMRSSQPTTVLEACGRPNSGRSSRSPKSHAILDSWIACSVG